MDILNKFKEVLYDEGFTEKELIDPDEFEIYYNDYSDYICYVTFYPDLKRFTFMLKDMENNICISRMYTEFELTLFSADLQQFLYETLHEQRDMLMDHIKKDG